MESRDYLAHETLNDGTPVTMRAIRGDDSSSILEAFKNLDRDAIYRRFFSPKRELSEVELKQLTNVDFDQVVALVVTTQAKEGEILIGGGRYLSAGAVSSQAEIAFLTDGKYRARGIASLILRHLVRIAREAGVSRFEADVLAENQSMLAVFRRSGLPMQVTREGGVLHVTLQLEEQT